MVKKTPDSVLKQFHHQYMCNESCS